MKPIAILVDSLADEGLINAQMINAQEIVRRLDSDEFSVTMFVHGHPAAEIAARPNTRLIQLPDRLQTVRLLAQFLGGSQSIVFYLKPSPAAQWFIKFRRLLRDRSLIVGTIESQSDWRDQTIHPRTIWLVEQTVLRCDYLFSNSAFVKRSLATNYSLESEVVPTGVDTDFFTPDWERAANARPRVLFVGALRTFKGPQVVLAAAERFPQADFVVVGDGIMAQELRQRAEALANVTMLGSLGRKAVREQYRAADIFLFPSRWEGSPRVLMEAAASGLPVIARKDYQPESVIDGKTGFLAASDDELMIRLSQLLASQDLCRALGHSARAHMARFSWNVITREWESIFRRLASEGGKDAHS